MVTYTDPVQKQWVMDSAEDFREGTIDGVELDNPNYAGKVVLECLLGNNILDTQERPWNPSFEEKGLPPNEHLPLHWSFEFPSTGSYYQQEDPEGAFHGSAYVVIRDESNEANQRGRLVLDPEGVPDPEHLNISVDPQKTYTVRYHGRYIKQGPGEDRGPVGRVGIKDDTAETEILEFEPFVTTEGILFKNRN
jgi:hypothetical protein